MRYAKGGEKRCMRRFALFGRKRFDWVTGHGGVLTEPSSVSELKCVSRTSNSRVITMTGHMPPIPKGNQSDKGPRSANADAARDTSGKDGHPQNTAEQSDTANIKQNTTNKGFFQGRRVK
jgi:hypothetical protein